MQVTINLTHTCFWWPEAAYSLDHHRVRFTRRGGRIVGTGFDGGRATVEWTDKRCIITGTPALVRRILSDTGLDAVEGPGEPPPARVKIARAPSRAVRYKPIRWDSNGTPTRWYIDLEE